MVEAPRPVNVRLKWLIRSEDEARDGAKLMLGEDEDAAAAGDADGKCAVM